MCVRKRVFPVIAAAALQALALAQDPPASLSARREQVDGRDRIIITGAAPSVLDPLRSAKPDADQWRQV